MPLGYKYAERDATSYVDWGEIGKNLSDMLTNENKLREQKKDALDAEQRATQKLLSEPPQGIDESMNEYTLKFTNDLQQASLLNYKLLKSGRLNPKDFTIKNQNLADGTNTLFNLSKEYQEQYKSAMDDYLSGDPDRELQDLTPFLMSHVEGYANFVNTKPIINEKDYTVTLAKMKFNEEKGVMEMSKDPNDFLSVSTLSNMIKQKYKKYNVQKAVGAYVDSLGDQLDTIVKLGEIHEFGTTTEIFDQTKIKNLPKNEQGIIMDFEQFETKMLTALLPTPFDYTSVLTNSIKFAPNKEIYTYTWNPEEAKKNENLILLKKDPQTKGIIPDLTQKQRDAAVEHLRLQARGMYDNKKKISVNPQKEINALPEWYFNARKTEREEEDLLNNLADNIDLALYGDDRESVLGIKNLGVQSKGGANFKKTKGVFGFNTYNDQGGVDKNISWNFKIGDKDVTPAQMNKSVSAIAKLYKADPTKLERKLNEIARRKKRSSLNTNAETESFDKIVTPQGGGTGGLPPRPSGN